MEERLLLLQKARPILILSEALGYIHDLGKLSKHLYNEHRKRLKNEDLPLIFDVDLSESFDEILVEEIKIFKTWLFSGEDRSSLRTVTMRHHNPQIVLEKIIELADKKDASEDRSKAIRKQKDATYFATVFGKEQELAEKDKLDDYRIDTYKIIEHCFRNVFNLEKNKFIANAEAWRNFRKTFYKVLPTYFRKAIAETQRSANDISLHDHSFMTGSITKALVAHFLLDTSDRARYHRFDTFDKVKHFEQVCNLKVLTVAFDYQGFISKVQRLPDIVGRINKIQKLKDEIREFLEFDIPLGNCIYEDNDSLCFLVPQDVNEKIVGDLQEMLIDKFNEHVLGVIFPVIKVTEKADAYLGPSLTRTMMESKLETNVPYLILNFSKITQPEWFHIWEARWEGHEKCLSCGRLPRKQGAELCSFCKETRLQGLATYLLGISSTTGRYEETPWLDEIADETGKVAAVIGCFSPLEEWLNGRLIESMKIRLHKDVEEAQNRLPTFKDAIHDFIKVFQINLKSGRDFLTLLRTRIYELKELYEGHQKIIGGRSCIGELYYRLDAPKQTIMKTIERELKPEEREELVSDLVRITTCKPPSPSRLFRVWRNLVEFTEEIINLIGMSLNYGKRLKVFPRDIFRQERGVYSVLFPKVGEVGVFFDGISFQTVEALPNDAIDFLKKSLAGMEIVVLENRTRAGKITVSKVDLDYYRPIRRIFTSPEGFAILLPAREAINAVRRIKRGYEKEFSKVLGRLSLSLGIIYFHRKFPISTIIEAIRMMTFYLRRVSSKMYDLQILDFNEKAGQRKMSFNVKNGPLQNQTVVWNFGLMLGNNEADFYHPYLMTQAKKWSHVSELQRGDIVKAYLNFFYYMHLTSSDQIYHITEIGLDSLESIDNLYNLWTNILKKKLTASQIRALEENAYHIMHNLRGLGQSEMEDYARYTVINICDNVLGDDEIEVVIKAMLDGYLGQAINIFMTIMKEKPEVE